MSYPKALALLAGAALLLAPTSGCMGLLDEDEEPRAQLFLGATPADGDATARLASASVALNGSENVSFDVEGTTHDLAQLAAEESVELAATAPVVEGKVSELQLVFDQLEVGGTSLAGAQLDVPIEANFTGQTTLTVTLDLDATTEEGEPVLRQAVAEEEGEITDTVTRAELEEPEEPPTLATPSIAATADGGNLTAPSFPVNEEISFGYTLPSSNEATVEDAFWSFGDDGTATGEAVQHAYRSAGFYRVTLVLEGASGQQVTAQADVEAYLVQEGEGNVGAGTGGEALVEDRDVSDHDVEMPENFTSVSIRLETTPSGNFCTGNDTGEEECAPSNVHVEWLDRDGELVGKNTSDEQVKWINVTGLMDAGTWTLRVKGDQGAAVGYSFEVESHYLGLCAERGGLEGYGCPGEPGSDGEGEGDDGSLP